MHWCTNVSRCVGGWRIARGGITGPTSIHLYRADLYKRYFLAIGGVCYNGVWLYLHQWFSTRPSWPKRGSRSHSLGSREGNELSFENYSKLEQLGTRMNVRFIRNFELDDVFLNRKTKGKSSSCLYPFFHQNFFQFIFFVLRSGSTPIPTWYVWFYAGDLWLYNWYLWFQVNEENILYDGTLIDLCGATLLWRSAVGLLSSPVRPYQLPQNIQHSITGRFYIRHALLVSQQLL